MKSQASAPGKVILAGEHSVVYGYPAVATAIGLRCTVRIDDSNADGLQITSDQLDASTTYTNQDLAKLAEHQVIHPRTDAIAAAVLAATANPDLHCTVSISSQIPMSAGLGSSAAVSVATVAATAAFVDHQLTPEAISELAFKSEIITHGRPSGIDNTVATFGGALRFQEGKFERINLLQSIPLLIVNTNIPRSTKDLVNGVRQRHDTSPELYTRLFGDMGLIADQVSMQLKTGKTDQLGDLFNKNQRYLEAIGVSHPMLTELASLSTIIGAAGAKLTGAGGGGCLIIYPSSEENAEEIADFLHKRSMDLFSSSLSPDGVMLDG